MIGGKLFSCFQILNGAGCIFLLQEGATQLEVSQFIVGHGLDNLAQKRNRLRQLALQEQRIAKVVHGVGIAWTKIEFGAKFPRRGFELILSEVDQTSVIVSF